MSNSNATSTTGVTGNTNIPQQQHAAAGSSATANRLKSFIKNNKVLVGALALAAVYTVITVFVSNDVGLGGLLVTLFLLRYAHKQYENNSKPTASSLIGHLIATVIALVIIASPLVQKPLEGFNWATGELGEVDMAKLARGGIGCPSPITTSNKKRPELKLQIGCDQRVIVVGEMKPEYVALDGRFDGPLSRYVDITWTSHNAMKLTPKKGSFPSGVNEVPVVIITEGEAAPLKSAADTALVVNALFGTTVKK